MILFDKWALVVGAGKSGTAAAALLLRQGRKVILYDGNRDLSPEARQKLREFEAACGKSGKRWSAA